jgi:uncharacterized protein (DUF1800 family)
MNPLAPYEPTPQDPFDLKKAGHLLRRAGFSASLREREIAVRAGVEATLERLFAGLAGGEADAGLADALALGGLERVRAHRCWRMLGGQTPLRDRLTLFWHGHFATSDRKVRNERMMAGQLATFDRLGGGRFDELLLAVARDPAMVRWLDNDSNHKGRPNENFARELFELFALGRGNYSEQDIKEAARAFTGWHLAGERFAFVAGRHDAGEKTVLGARGRLGGDDVVALAATHAASARFLATKWLQFFVRPEPAADEVGALAAEYRKNDRDVGRTLRVLLRSRLFFSAASYRALVKSPFDYAVGLVRSCGAGASPQRIGTAAGAMGQALLEPPSVEGWRGGRAWVTSASWIVRSNFAAELFAGRGGYRLAPDAEAILGPVGPRERGELALEILVDGDVPDAARERILAFAASRACQGPGGAGALLHAVATLPEAHLL